MPSQVVDHLTPRPKTVLASAPAAEAAELLARDNVRDVLVLDELAATTPAAAAPQSSIGANGVSTGTKAAATTPVASPAMPLKAMISRESHDFRQPRNAFHIFEGLPRCSTAAPRPANKSAAATTPRRRSFPRAANKNAPADIWVSTSINTSGWCAWSSRKSSTPRASAGTGREET